MREVLFSMNAEPEPELEPLTPDIATGRRSLLQRHQGFTAHLEANQQAKSVTRGCLEMSMARSYGGHTFTFNYKYRY